MQNIIKDLFFNCTIIISAVTFANMLMRDGFLRSKTNNHLLTGFLTGILSCVLMLNSVAISPEVILDFRFIPIILMGIYVSFWSSVEASLIIAVFRIAYFGVNKASIISAVVTILVGFGCGLIGKLKLPIWLKWLLALMWISIGSSAGLSLVIQDSALLSEVVLYFIVSMSVACTLMYFFAEFIVESNRRYARIKEENMRDALTDLHNVRHFDRSLNHHAGQAIAERESLSLLFIDIDHFKKINDQYGHLNGDLVLIEISKILTKLARSQDTVSRNGGEEFTVLLTGCNLKQAGIVGERIRKTIEKHDFILSDHTVAKITVSIGIASIPETTLDEEKLIEQADIALYQAKRSGRNQVALAE